MKRSLFAGLSALVVLGGVMSRVIAQPSSPVFVHVTAAAPTPVSKNVSGGKSVVVLQLTIDKGYHLQGNNARDPYVPTSATVVAPAGVTIGKITYPPSVVKEFTGEKLPVYEGKVEIKIPVTVATSVKDGVIKLPVTVKYQGCNTQSCYPPTSLTTSVSIKVGAAK